MSWIVETLSLNFLANARKLNPLFLSIIIFWLRSFLRCDIRSGYYTYFNKVFKLSSVL